MRVDFPDPFRPNRTVTPPGTAHAVADFNTSLEPNLFTKESATKRGSGVFIFRERGR